MYTGIFWLIYGMPKFQAPEFMETMPRVIHKLASGTGGPYHAFMTTLIAPHAEIVAQMIRAGEVLVGISLLLGLVSRAGAIGGIFLALNYLLAKGALGSVDTYAGLDFVALVLSLANLVLPTAAALSMDSLKPRSRRRR